MNKSISRIIGVIMLIVAFVFIMFALNHPEKSFPWNNTIPIFSILQTSIFVLCDFPINGNFSLLHFRSNKQHYCHKKIYTIQ